MKELGRQRRQAQLPSPERRQSDSIPSTAPGSPPEVQEDEKTIELRRLLAEREAKVLALQENHDRLLLDNARLQNMLDEMRAKLRVHQLKNQQKVPVRRTNSPSDLKGDPLAASTAHGSNGQQDHPSTSCLELMMLPTAVASAGDNRPGDNNTSSSFSNYSSSIGSVSDSASNGDCNSIVHRDHRREHAIHLAAPTAANEQLGYQQHRHMILENRWDFIPCLFAVLFVVAESKLLNYVRRPLKTSERTRLLQQLKEATLAALFVRDQTRTLIHRMNRLPSWRHHHFKTIFNEKPVQEKEKKEHNRWIRWPNKALLFNGRLELLMSCCSHSCSSIFKLQWKLIPIIIRLNTRYKT